MPWPVRCGLIVAVVILVRLVLMDRLALTDNTESRYALISWQMFHSGDWITPWIYMDGQLVPFWGKPPLQFWLVALAYHLFGVSEWSARLPSLLLGIFMVARTIAFARRFWGDRVAYVAGALLATSGMFYFLAGSCMLDVPLAAAVTLAMEAFARCVSDASPRRAWGLTFFLALGLGMLAKGPVTLVLVGLALGLWLLGCRQWRLLARLPWFLGSLLFVAVAAPWYVLAERATPGFLRYFFINEHILRYLVHEYGDRYGAGRKQPYGMSWAMLAAAMLPWTALAVSALERRFRGQKLLQTLRNDPWFTYVLAWGLTAPLFFTFARQLVFAYLLPALPGLAIAVAVALDRWMESDDAPRLTAWLRWHFVAPAFAAPALAVAVARGLLVMDEAAVVAALVVLTLLAAVGWMARWSVRYGLLAAVVSLGLVLVTTFGAAAFFVGPSVDEQQSAKEILARVYQDPTAKTRPVVMPFGEAHSAIFYAEVVFQGRFEHHKGDAELVRQLLDQPGSTTLLFKRSDWQSLPSDLAQRLVPIAESRHWVAGQRTSDPQPTP